MMYRTQAHETKGLKAENKNKTTGKYLNKEKDKQEHYNFMHNLLYVPLASSFYLILYLLNC